MTTHVVKCSPEYFPAYLDGTKPWSLRKNDRDYQDGDLLHVQEWDGGRMVGFDLDERDGCTGRDALFRIVKVWTGLPALRNGHAILTLEPMVRETVDGAKEPIE